MSKIKPRHRRNPERHGRRNLRAGRETGQGTAGQGWDDVRAADREDQVGVKLLTETVSDMDAEITALEGKQVKARQVKAGMMSELLGGEDQVGVGVKLLTQLIFERQ